jgi:hypothetical protein
MFSDPFFFSCLSDGCHPVFNLHAGGLPAILAGGHLRFTLPRLEHLITCRRLPGSRAFRSSLWSEGKQAGTLCLQSGRYQVIVPTTFHAFWSAPEE